MSDTLQRSSTAVGGSFKTYLQTTAKTNCALKYTGVRQLQFVGGGFKLSLQLTASAPHDTLMEAPTKLPEVAVGVVSCGFVDRPRPEKITIHEITSRTYAKEALCFGPASAEPPGNSTHANSI